MGNRILKESICTSEKLAKLSHFEFRLWVGLLTQADDYGCGDGRAAILRNFIFPLQPEVTVQEVARAMKRLEKLGCIGLYEVDGAPYFWFPTWLDHQRLRSHKPKFPQPPELQSIVGEKREKEAQRKANRQKAGKSQPYDYVPVYEPFEDEGEAQSATEETVQRGREEPSLHPPSPPEEEKPMSGFSDRECIDLVRSFRRRGRPLTDNLRAWAEAHPWLLAEAERELPAG